jgi:hypothetical protein
VSKRTTRTVGLGTEDAVGGAPGVEEIELNTEVRG